MNKYLISLTCLFTFSALAADQSAQSERLNEIEARRIYQKERFERERITQEELKKKSDSLIKIAQEMSQKGGLSENSIYIYKRFLEKK